MMAALQFDAAGKLVITPAPFSTKNDFDFFIGRWNIKNRKLTRRLANCNDWIEFDATQECKKILNGTGNTDNFITSFDGQPFEGMTLRLFDPVKKLWSIYWADSTTGILDKPVVGSFENNIGHFYSQEKFGDADVIAVFKWDATDPAKPVWSQALSPDNGKTWEWNWYMYMTEIV